MSPRRPPVPKPPAAESQRCQATNVYGGQCGNAATWALPEFPICAHHRYLLTDELRDLRDRRIAAWEAWAADLWQQVLADFPPPEDYP